MMDYKRFSKNMGTMPEKTISVTMSGQEGSAKIAALMKQFRDNAPTEFAGAKVLQTEDFKELTKQTLKATLRN